jgi:hypothetical protein
VTSRRGRCIPYNTSNLDRFLRKSKDTDDRSSVFFHIEGHMAIWSLFEERKKRDGERELEKDRLTANREKKLQCRTYTGLRIPICIHPGARRSSRTSRCMKHTKEEFENVRSLDMNPKYLGDGDTYRDIASLRTGRVSTSHCAGIFARRAILAYMTTLSANMATEHLALANPKA